MYDTTPTKNDRLEQRMIEEADEILQKIMHRRNYTTETRDKLAERLVRIVKKETKK